MAGQVQPFQQLRASRIDLRDQALRQRGQPSLRRDEHALKDRNFLAGKYSIADMACVGWVNGWERQGQNINEFPNVKTLVRDREGTSGGQARHGARPRTAPGHRHEGPQGAGRAVRPARAGELTLRLSVRWWLVIPKERGAIRHQSAEKPDLPKCWLFEYHRGREPFTHSSSIHRNA